MKKVSLTLALTVFLLQPIFVSAEETCEEFTASFPSVTEVADLDANGVVNGRDIAILAKTIRKNKRISRGNGAIEKSNHRSRHHRGEERSNSRRLKEPQQIVYSLLLDRNSDGEINYIDMFKATRDMGKTSTPEDQELATNYNEFLAGNYVCATTVEAAAEAAAKAAAKAAAEAAAEAAALAAASASDCPFDPDYCQYINSQ